MTAPARPRPTSRATRSVLAGGTTVAVACFSMALLLEFLGRPLGGGAATDLGAITRSALALEPWGWATLGTFAVIASPVLAIAATAVEFARVDDRRTAWTAAAVLLVLGVSLAVALAAR